MLGRHLFNQSILCRRQFAVSSIPRLLPAPPVANSLIPLHRRSYAAYTRQPRDDEIKKLCREIQFIDAEGTFQGVKNLKYILSSFDREMYTLLSVNPHVAPEPVICKLVSREKLEAEEKAAYLAKKAKKRNSKDPSKVSKTIEISWATAANDLIHKMKRINEFLQKGNRVEVIMGVKKGMAKQPLAKMEELVNRIRAEVEDTAKEWKEAEGKIGVQYQVFLEGRRPKAGGGTGPVEGGGLTDEERSVEKGRSMHAEGSAEEERSTEEEEPAEEKGSAEEGSPAGETKTLKEGNEG